MREDRARHLYTGAVTVGGGGFERAGQRTCYEAAGDQVERARVQSEGEGGVQPGLDEVVRRLPQSTRARQESQVR